MKRSRSVLIAAALIGSTGLALSGCSSGGGGGGSNSTVEILGAFTAAQAKAFQADLDKWGKTSGVKAKYTGSSNFQTVVVTRVTAGDPPAVAIYPQPGVLKQQTDSLVSLDGVLKDLNATISDEAKGLPDIAKVNGKIYGLPYSVNIKSLVWYNPKAFAAHGYTVPKTDEELSALTDKIKADGAGYPWCVGIEDGAATGWGATDWLEEYVLDYGGLDKYNQWITHKVKFEDPLIVKAGQKEESILLTPGNVNGGGQAIATTAFGSAGNPLFVDGKANGQCFMMRQGTFIADFFPDNIKAQIASGDYSNVDLFPLPEASGGVGNGVLGGGDLVGAFNNDANTKKVVDYLTGKDFGTNGYSSQAIFLSPHANFDKSLYKSKFQTVAADSVANADFFGFDASDQMPGAVGAGTEWKSLTEWISGQKTLQDALKAIDDSWPSS